MTQERLYKYLRGESTAAERQQILQWINESPKNMETYRTMRNVYDTMLCGESDLHLRKISSPRHHNVMKRTASTLMGIGMCAAVFFGIQSVNHHTDTVLMTTNPVDCISTPIGQHTELTLTDGTHVWLSSNSQLRMPADGTPRRVSLTGEAYFAVAKNTEVPFIVSTEGRSITVHGTRFNVIALDDDRNLTVQLYDGSVSVTDSIFHRSTTLTPGKQLTACNSGITVSDFDCSDSEPLWIHGIHKFQNSTFTEILTTMSRVYNARLVLETTWTDRQRCTGKFHEADGLQNLLESLDNVRPFTYQWDPDTRELRIK